MKLIELYCVGPITRDILFGEFLVKIPFIKFSAETEFCELIKPFINLCINMPQSVQSNYTTISASLVEDLFPVFQ